MSDPKVIYLYDFQIQGHPVVKNWTAQSIEDVRRNKGFNVREYKASQSSEIKQVTDWIDAAGQEPSVRNLANYLAYTMSELAECLKELHHGKNLDFELLAGDLEETSQLMRDGIFDDCVERANLVGLMDGAIDTAWCAIGLAHMLGNAQGAFAEVVASNYSKFEGGVCQLDATGKVIKGPGYFKPELSKFLRGSSDE